LLGLGCWVETTTKASTEAASAEATASRTTSAEATTATRTASTEATASAEAWELSIGLTSNFQQQFYKGTATL
jgi:hypothetical protein